MGRVLAVIAVLSAVVPGVAVPGVASADEQVALSAPYAAGDHVTQCQWIAAQTDPGACTISAEPDAETGAIALDATIESPDSPAGPHTAPTWGQAVSYGAMFAGYHLAVPADRITFTFTWHIDDLRMDVEGPPQLAWTNFVAAAQLEHVECRCSKGDTSVDLSPTMTGTDVTATITVTGSGFVTNGPDGQQFESFPIPAGTFVIKAGFNAQSGLIASPGSVHTMLRGHISHIAVDEVDAPPPPPEI